MHQSVTPWLRQHGGCRGWHRKIVDGLCWRLDVSSAHRPAVPHIGVKRLIVVTNSPGAISGKRTLR
jgi:hypothetical protein